MIAAAHRVAAAEEMVEPDLVQRGRRGVRRDVPADAVVCLVGPAHHHRGVPPDDLTDPALYVLIAGKIGLLFRSDRVDVVGRHHGGQPDLPRTGVQQDLVEKEPGAGRRLLDHLIQRLDPFLGLVGIDVGQLVLE
jgi:hypothetical protein